MLFGSEARLQDRPLVLVVDDDLALRDVMAEMLDEWGYDVHTARNGQEALFDHIAAGHDPRAVILDLEMPVLDGYGFLARLAAEHAEHAVAVVVCSATAEDASRLRASEHVAEVVRKPFDARTLRAVIDRLAPQPRP